MKTIIISISIILITLFLPDYIQAQTHTTTVSKNCGSCGGAVSSSARVGQRCPYCGVIWGRENTTTTNRRTTTPDYDNFSVPDVTLPKVSSNDNMYESSNTTRNSKLRASPSATAQVLGIIPANASVIITRKVGDWVKVSFIGSFLGSGSLDNYHGWLPASNVVW